MSIKRTIIATVLALAMVAVVAPGVTQAVTIDELMAQIATLQAQLLALQQAQGGGTPVPTGSVACAGITFTRNLVIGSTGSDVKCAQVLLNNNGFTLAQSGAGSPGMETSYFGPLTLAAVRVFQTSKGWTPANQVGPLTRAAFNALINTTPPVYPTLPVGCTSNPANPAFSPITGQSCATGYVPPVIIPTGAGLTVMLASDNPASGTLVSGATATDGQGAADIAHLTFVNGDNAPVNITSLKLNRIGVSTDTLLNNVYLYQGATRLTDAATVASAVVTFTGSPLFTVPAGGSVTIKVVVDLLYGLSGQTVGVSVPSAASVTTNASSVKGTFPVSGNLFTTASATLATASFASTTYPYTSGSSATTVDPQNDYDVWRNTVSIGTRAVTLSRLALLQTGSAPAGAIQNYRLFISGTQAGSAVAQPNADGYITFDLSGAPVRIETGSREVKVLADIIAGSSLTFSYSLRVSADAVFTDTQVGVSVIPLANSTTFTQRRSCNYNTSSYGCTINSGAITFSKATDSPAGKVILSAPGATFAKYTLTASGEPVKISDLYVCISDATTSPAYFRNGALFANGVQVGRTADIKSTGTAACSTATTNANATHFALGSALIVNPGSPVSLEVKADVHELSGTAVASGDSVFTVVTAGSANATGQVSKNSISTPSSGVAGNTLTVSTGALTLSKYTGFPNQNVVAPLTNSKLAHFTMTSNTTEAVNLNTLVVNVNAVSSYLTNLYAKVGNTTLPAKSSGAAANTWAFSYNLPAGQTVDITVFGDVSSSMTSGDGVVSAYVNGTTSDSATSVCGDSVGTCVVGSENDLDGQTITFTSGVWTVALDGSTPLAQAVAGGQTVVVGKYKFTSSNDSNTVTEVRFTVANPTNTASAGVINSLTLKDGTTALATVPYDSVNNRFTIANSAGIVTVPTNTSKVLTAELSLTTPYTDGTTDSSASTAPTVNTTGKNLALTLSYVERRNSAGTVTNTAPAKEGNAIFAYKTVPTFTVGTVTGQGTNLHSGSSTTLYNFSVKADSAGPVALKQLKFAVTITDGNSTSDNETLDTFKFFRGSTDLTSTSVTIQNPTPQSLESTTYTIPSGAATDVIVTFDTEEVIPAGQTYTYSLRARGTNFTTAAAGNDSVSTYLKSDTASTGGTTDAQTLFFLDASSSTVPQKLYSSASAGVSGTAYNVIWSDNSAQIHDYTYDSTSSDWFNGYLINDLPLDSVGVVTE